MPDSQYESSLGLRRRSKTTVRRRMPRCQHMALFGSAILTDHAVVIDLDLRGITCGRPGISIGARIRVLALFDFHWSMLCQRTTPKLHSLLTHSASLSHMQLMDMCITSSLSFSQSRTHLFSTHHITFHCLSIVSAAANLRDKPPQSVVTAEKSQRSVHLRACLN